MRNRIICLFLSIAGVLTLCGCGEDPNNPAKLLPVTGTATLDGRPLTAGMVSFVPDEGNAYRVEPVGALDANGEYELTTGGKAGAPPGKYKVCVTLDELEREKRHKKALSEKKSKAPPAEIRRIYAAAATTPLVVEVIASPPEKVYDLTLTSK